jgi:hypothetical protein
LESIITIENKKKTGLQWNSYHGLMQRRSRIAGPVVLLAIVILFNWKLVLTKQFTWLESPDIANQVLPWYQFEAREWRAGHFPMWDPNEWAGQSMFGEMQPGAAYPLNWILFKFGGSDRYGISPDALHWYWVLIHYLAALNCFLLCRDLGRSVTASILAGCIFALGGFVGRNDWPQMVNGAVWAPLVLMFLLRVARGDRRGASAALAGFFAGVSWLSGHHQAPIYISIAFGATWLWLMWRGGGRMIKFAAISVAMLILASALQTLPAAEYGRAAVRWTSMGDHPLHFDEPVSYAEHARFGLRPLSILGVFIPQIESNSDPYVGIAATALALLAICLAWKQSEVRYLSLVALGGIVYALGSNSLLHGVLYSMVPMAEKARNPSMAIVIFAAGFAPLVAFGADRLAAPESFPWMRRAAFTLAGFGAIVAIAGLVIYATRAQMAIADDRIMIPAYAALLGAALLTAVRSGSVSARAATAAFLAIALFELANVTNYWLPDKHDAARSRFLSKLREPAEQIAYIKSHDPLPRIEYDAEAIPPNIGDWYGVSAFDAYVASMQDNLARQEMGAGRVRDFFGVRYFIGKTPRRPDSREVFAGSNGLKVFENPNAFPRVWTVHESVAAADRAMAIRLIPNAPAELPFDPRRQVFFEGSAGPALEKCEPSGESAAIKRYASQRVEVDVRMNCRGMLILSALWAPGWKATVDGEDAAVHEAYSMVRGVVVPAGAHHVEMRYRPASVIFGALMTALAAVVALTCVSRARRGGFSLPSEPRS